ncbi:MAG: DsbA family protein [Pseudomonadota bacterium]
MTTELLYVANPMCSWCYGFHVGLASAVADRTHQVVVTLSLGALRADTEPMRPEQKTYLREAWTRVGEASSQPFDTALLDRDDFVYDTRPASRAVAAVRDTRPDRVLAYLGAVQEAFYRDNRDVTEPSVLAAVAAETDIGAELIETALGDPKTATALEAENHAVAQLGITGYPTLIAMTSPRPTVVALGFKPPDALAEALDELDTRPRH